MKNILFFALIFCLVFISCEDQVEGLDQDPNAFSDAAPELIVGKAQLGWMLLYGSNPARYSSIFSNQFSGTDRQYITVENYSLSPGEFNDDWNNMYANGLVAAQLADEKALANGNNILAGVAEISEAAMMGMTTALWGDVPYTEANNAEINFPSFDGQMSVFSAVQSLLDMAIDNVGDASVSEFYSGNRLESESTWAEVAHSLKARFYLHTGDYSSALTEARAGISTYEGTLFSEHNSAPEGRNLYYQFTVDERQDYLTATNSHLYKMLDPNDDEVNRILVTPGDTVRFANYFAGIQLNTGEGGRFAQTASFPLISYYETKLIEAEAAYRLGNEGEALAALNEVREQLAIEFDSDFPASSASGEDLLIQILEEKWITLVGEIEAWNDIRRTDNILNIPPKTGGQIPQRFLVPQDELDINPNAPSGGGLFDKTPVNM